MCWTGPFEFRWLKEYIHNPCYNHHQIGNIHLSHCCHIFRGFVSEMVVLSYSVIYYIYIPGTLGPCFHYWYSVYGICKWADTLWPVGRVRLFADYTISLSSLCRPIWRHWTTKMLVRYVNCFKPSAGTVQITNIYLFHVIANDITGNLITCLTVRSSQE